MVTHLRLTTGLMHCLARAGVYARLQPAAAEFQKEVGGDVREVLEAALARHSTLSEGDWLSAEHAGRAYDLRVQKLRPAAAVSVIGARSSGADCCTAPCYYLPLASSYLSRYSCWFRHLAAMQVW